MKTQLLIFSILMFSIPALSREVELSWNPMDGAIKYEIQISETDKFDQPLVSNQIDIPKFATQLKIGSYRYRVRVIDQKGKPGKWSKSTPLMVTPYAPELLEPQSGFEVSYYEVKPEIEFSWKSVEDKAQYEIFVYKKSGQKAFESGVADLKTKINQLEVGEYAWKVRTVFQQKLFSPYSEPRDFKIIKKELMTPELIKPEDKGVSPAFRALGFEWKKDPAAKYTDLYFEKTKAVHGGETFKKKIDNLTDSTFTSEYEEPGQYKWSVTTKEAQDTPGVSSRVGEFEVRNDLISSGNYELEFNMSSVSDLYSTTSTRQTAGTTNIAQQTTSGGLFYGFTGGYYLLEEVGFFLSTRTGSMAVETETALAQETDFTLRLRFGKRGFNQEFWFGYRAMDLLEVENTPSVLSTHFTTLGPLFGTRFTATVIDGWRAQFGAYYFKPTANIESIDGLVADVYGGFLSVKWNFMYQFWLGYRFSIARVNGSFKAPGVDGSINSSWTQYRTEPFALSISFEH